MGKLKKFKATKELLQEAIDNYKSNKWWPCCCPIALHIKQTRPEVDEVHVAVSYTYLDSLKLAMTDEAMRFVSGVDKALGNGCFNDGGRLLSYLKNQGIPMTFQVSE